MKLSLHAKNPFFLLQIQPQNKAAMLYPWERKNTFILVVKIFTWTRTETNWFPAAFKRETKLSVRSMHSETLCQCVTIPLHSHYRFRNVAPANYPQFALFHV
jgi:hypothetical protein